MQSFVAAFYKEGNFDQTSPHGPHRALSISWSKESSWCPTIFVFVSGIIPYCLQDRGSDLTLPVMKTENSVIRAPVMLLTSDKGFGEDLGRRVFHYLTFQCWDIFAFHEMNSPRQWSTIAMSGLWNVSYSVKVQVLGPIQTCCAPFDISFICTVSLLLPNILLLRSK